MITQDELKKHLHYDLTTGIFTRKTALCNRVRIGDIAGTIDGFGYLRIRVAAGRPIRAHRLAWLYVYGEAPESLDHIDGDRLNNSIINLRVVTSKQNSENQKLRSTNKTGHRGVYWVSHEGKYKAQVGHNRGVYHLGTFEKLEDAVKAAKDFRDRVYTHHKTPYSS